MTTSQYLHHQSSHVSIIIIFIIIIIADVAQHQQSHSSLNVRQDQTHATTDAETARKNTADTKHQLIT